MWLISASREQAPRPLCLPVVAEKPSRAHASLPAPCAGYRKTRIVARFVSRLRSRWQVQCGKHKTHCTTTAAGSQSCTISCTSRLPARAHPQLGQASAHQKDCRPRPIKAGPDAPLNLSPVHQRLIFRREGQGGGLTIGRGGGRVHRRLLWERRRLPHSRPVSERAAGTEAGPGGRSASSSASPSG